MVVEAATPDDAVERCHERPRGAASHFDLAVKAFGNAGGQQYGLTMIGHKMVVGATSAAPTMADLPESPAACCILGRRAIEALRGAGCNSLVAVLGPENAVPF